MVVASADVRLPRFLRRDAGVEVDRLYRRHSQEVLRYALLVLRSRTDAEDITQTVFLRALRAIERGERVRAPRNWLIKITHNECRRLVASRKLTSELPDEIAVEPAEPGRAEELRVAMAALPETQRQALVLRELEGRTYAEISKSLDLSESAVETLIFRARRALREQIENAMSCEEFAELLADPSARTRVRAHARVCPECATLDHQSRGRKSALKRIASSLGLPWWGVKLTAIALTTATVAAVAVAVPHDPSVPVSKLNLIPPSTQLRLNAQPSHHLNLIPPSSRPKLASPGGGTRFKSFSPTPAHARSVVAATPTAAATPSAVLPGPEPPAPTAPEPDPTQPAPLPSPTKIVPVTPPAVVPVTPQAVVPVPAVAVPQTGLPPAPVAPAVTVPTVSVPIQAPALPAVTLPVETPNVSLP
jgi:RNA polymerase sigma factor (sigma-70 family)